MFTQTFVCLFLITFTFLSGGATTVDSTEPSEHANEDDLWASLLAEAETTLGTGSATTRLRQMEAILKFMYAALPKNQHGNLGHATVRYALHRLFDMRHGWRIKGLGWVAEATSSTWTSPAAILKDQVPDYIYDMFDKHLGDKGLNLQQLALLAGTIEHVIQQEVVGNLGEVFKLHGIGPAEQVGKKKANELLDNYMMAYIMGENVTNMTLRHARLLTAEMPTMFGAWNDTKAFVRTIRTKVAANASEFDFPTLAKVVEMSAKKYGTFQDRDCRKLKNTLMSIETPGTGRVRLAKFYKPGAKSDEWQFQESVRYLRQLGALDESDPKNKRVIIANYLYSHTNCIAPTSFSAMCCKDECEGLLGHLEGNLAAPEATAATIVAHIEKLPSSTVNISRKLSTTLLRRLDDIAIEHGGMVPLHSRLFAQWMHHAYPRECPFPHLSGTTVQQMGEEYRATSGYESRASEKEVLKYTSAAKEKIPSSGVDEHENLLPWWPEEELLTAHFNPRPVAAGSRFANLRHVAFVFVAGSFAFSLVQMTLRLRSSDDAKVIII